MGVFNWIKDKVASTGKLLKNTLVTSGTYAFGTISHLFEFIGAVPKTLKAIYDNRRASKVMKNLGYIAVTDLLPLVTLNAVNQFIQSQLKSEDSKNPAWLSSAFILSSSLTLLNIAVKSYSFRKGVQMSTRSMIVSLNSANAMNQLNPQENIDSLCTDKCSTIKKIKGSGREFFELMGNDLVVSCIGQLPGLSKLAWLLSVYARGRYIVKTMTPERCPDHRGIKSEYALATGLNHEGMMWLVSYGFRSTVGLPPTFCLKTVQQMLLIFQMAIAAEVHPPIQKPGEETLPFDPMDAYEKLIGFSSKVLASGLIKQIPALLKKSQNRIPWQAIGSIINKISQWPITAQLRSICLPPMLQSSNNFIKDPVIHSYWPAMRDKTDMILSYIIDVPKKQPGALRMVKWAPKAAASAIKMFVGIPKPLTKGLIILIGDKSVRLQMEAIRDGLRKLKTDSEIIIHTEGNTPALRSVGEEKELIPTRRQNHSKTLLETDSEEDIETFLAPKETDMSKNSKVNVEDLLSLRQRDRGKNDEEPDFEEFLDSSLKIS